MNQHTTAIPVNPAADTQMHATSPPYSGNGAPHPIFTQYYTAGKTIDDVFNSIEWGRCTALIDDDKGNIVAKYDNVEVPKSWSQKAINVVADKYLAKAAGNKLKENSVRQLITRVVDSTANFGRKYGYFHNEAEFEAYRAELAHILVTQKMAFNSPVWFNVGKDMHGDRFNEKAYFTDPITGETKLDTNGEHPQVSACFINGMKDNMESILGETVIEGMSFKYGSGTGYNCSPLRGSGESLSGGGRASGPIEFIKAHDRSAGAIKSGGRTRRAARMVLLDDDHPDMPAFIDCKANEEVKADILIDAGYGGNGVEDEAHATVAFQNGNNSLRVSDEFMEAVERDGEWSTINRVDGKVAATYKARELFKKIGEAAWRCGDPGLQFDTTINEWHTCPNYDKIRASNPCSEYMFANDTACNLASLNITGFMREDGTFDIDGFKNATRVTILAQEILVDQGQYGTANHARLSHIFRTLGIGYANIGAYLMLKGLPYDSPQARALAGGITAVMTGEAYAASAEIAARMGAFKGFNDANDPCLNNREAMLNVIRKHKSRVSRITSELQRNPAALANSPNGYAQELEEIVSSAAESWDCALRLGLEHGYRNAQVSVLAPTGTISYMMDCDTNGIEPELGLKKFKDLVGGGQITLRNGSLGTALKRLGYSPLQTERIVDYVDKNETIEGAPGLNPEHLPIFDCALKPPKGKRTIHYLGHLKMMAAVQPFLSGAISKTVNLPEELTPEQVGEVYMQAWRLGLKAVALYRNKCKRNQPNNFSGGKKTPTLRPQNIEQARRNVLINLEDKLIDDEIHRRGRLLWGESREPLEENQQALARKVRIQGVKYHITINTFKDGSPAEIFVLAHGPGQEANALLNALSVSYSKQLRHGLPLDEVLKQMEGIRAYEGYTDDDFIKSVSSVWQYVARYIRLQFQGVMSGIPETEKKKINPNKLYTNRLRRIQAIEEALDEAEMQVPKANGNGQKGKKKSKKNPLAKLLAERLGGTNGTQLKDHVNTSDAEPEERCPHCNYPLPPLAGCANCIHCGEKTGGVC